MKKLLILAMVVLGALVAIVLLQEASAQTQTITICKKTIPPGGTGFPFNWANSFGSQGLFLLNDGQCNTVNVTNLDKFNEFKENVPPGWTLTNIACTYTTSVVNIIGANPNPAFQPGDNTVTIDLTEANVTCTFVNTAIQHPSALPTDVYAVKFLCGTFFQEGPVKPGDYATAINVHNPNGGVVSFRKKAVLLYRADQPPTDAEFELPKPPYPFVGRKLSANWGLEIDCDDIRNVLLHGPVPPPAPPAPTFIKGWVVIEVPATPAPPIDGGLVPPLDVTAVYTATGGGFDPFHGGGIALEIKSVLPKRITK